MANPKGKTKKQEDVLIIDLEGKDLSKVVFQNARKRRKTKVTHSGSKNDPATGIQLETTIEWDYSGCTADEVFEDANGTNTIAFGNFGRKQDAVDFVLVLGYEGEIDFDLSAEENRKNLRQTVPVQQIHRNHSSNPLAEPETPEQFAAIIKAQAAKMGLSMADYIEKYLK